MILFLELGMVKRILSKAKLLKNNCFWRGWGKDCYCGVKKVFVGCGGGMEKSALGFFHGADFVAWLWGSCYLNNLSMYS